MASTHLLLFQRFAQYNAWFNERVYQLAEGLGEDARRRDLGAFFTSLHGTLAHILLGDRMWLGRFARPEPGNDFHFASLEGAELVYQVESLAEDRFPVWANLRAERVATDAVLRRFVHELSPEHLGADLHYRNSKGVSFCHPVWHVLAHVFNHQTHHRGQATTLLSQLGVDPGITDFMVTAAMPPEAP